MEYISTTQMQSRLTPHGIVWVADHDASGTGVTPDEEEAYVVPAIQFAGAIVDSYIQGRVNPIEARASQNQWLMDRCLDLAVCRALEIGGRNAPESIVRREEQTLDWLKEVQNGSMTIPGYTYPAAVGGSRDMRGPQAFNPRRPDR